MNDAILTDLQADIAERLRADDYFVDIPVLDERKADLVSEIDMALGTLTEAGGKMGLCAVVLSPVGNDDMPDAPGGPLQVDISVLILENVLLNTGETGTGKPALDVARRVHRLLKHYRAFGLAQAMVAGRPAIVPVDNPLAGLAYEVRFKAQESDGTGIGYTKVAMPLASGGPDPVATTMTCNTAGATILYTLDGSYPSAANGAELYSAPVVIPDGSTLRLAAYKTDCIPSDVNRVEF